MLTTLKTFPVCYNSINRLNSTVASTGQNGKRKTTQLKELIKSPQMEIIMEAHSGLSARIVEEVGFKGIWASGLAISALLGVRDSNEASSTEVTQIVEYMADATSRPILFDADTGFGNFNNARRLVSKLEKIGVAGMCIEDKIFPKTNAFVDGRKTVLADIEEFSLKIKACKEAQKDPDFIVVGRVEALNAGCSMDEALRRAEAYRNAGADAILMHTKKSDISELEAFMKVWKNQGPVVVIPTKYYKTPTEDLEKMGASLSIFANQTVRATITAMQKILARVYKDRSLVGVHDEIASISEVFRLQREDELTEAEKKYLP